MDIQAMDRAHRLGQKRGVAVEERERNEMQISADHTRDHRHAIAEGGGGEATAGAHRDSS